jgi:hypothetical protein
VLGKETTLGQLVPKRSALVTSLLLGKPGEPWRPVLLHNLPTEDADARLGRDMTVLDAALSNSAAPVDFAPHRVAKVGYLADGGVFANNPCVATVTTALRDGRPLDGIRLLSVGTGSVASYMRVPPWEHVSDKAGGSRCSLLAWLLPRAHDGVPATPLLAAMFDAGAAADELYWRGLVRGGYGRIQVRLEKDVALDDVSAVPGLVAQADAYFESKQ